MVSVYAVGETPRLMLLFCGIREHGRHVRRDPSEKATQLVQPALNTASTDLYVLPNSCAHHIFLSKSFPQSHQSLLH